jgi:hypothetical protein
MSSWTQANMMNYRGSFMVNPIILNFFGKTMRVTPSLPRGGGSARGAHPLTPLSFSCFWREFLVHPSNELYQYPKKIYKNLPAPPCLGEALKLGNLVNSILSVNAITISDFVTCFEFNQKRVLKEHHGMLTKGMKRQAVYYFFDFFPLTQML